MKRSPHTAILRLMAVAVLLAAPLTASDEGMTFEIDPCSGCHEEQVTEFEHNPHTRTGARDAGLCIACHEGAEAHAEEADPELVAIPKGEMLRTMCLSCHGPGEMGRLESRTHYESGTQCLDCHQIHQAGPETPALLAKGSANELCQSCHPSVANSFRKPYGHRLEPGGMECISCHSPYGRTAAEAFVVGQAEAGRCADCHFDKDGPFVFEHVSHLVGDCGTCHQPHGSSNPKRLKRARVQQLCLECHTGVPGGTLGAQAVSSHDIRSPRYQNCTTCHRAIHGSNQSPQFLK